MSYFQNKAGSMLRNFFRKKKDNETKESVKQEPVNDEINKDVDRSLLAKAGYTILQGTIGEGTFSKVKRAYSRYHDKDIAIKIINRDHAASDFLERFLPRELKLILGLKHDNICRYYDIVESGNKIYIMMEYAANGDVLEYILKHKIVEETSARKIFRQILSGVKYLHQRNILHRDLKCENILLSSDYRVLITDFGFAKDVEDINCLNQTYCGSSAYAPIEILNGMPYNGCAADIWSLGCILFIMTTGTMPFDDTNKNSQIVSMRKGPTFSRSKQKLSLECHILIRLILNPEVEKRATIKIIENSKWCLLKNYRTNTSNQPCSSGTKAKNDQSSTIKSDQASTEKKARRSLHDSV